MTEFAEDARTTNNGMSFQCGWKCVLMSDLCLGNVAPDWAGGRQRGFLEGVLTTCIKCEFEFVGFYENAEFCSIWKS